MFLHRFTTLLVIFLLSCGATEKKAEATSAAEDSAAMNNVLPISAKGRKFALLVGIDKYRSGDVPLLNGAKNDVAKMKNTLVKRFGFPDSPSSIVTLTDTQATTANIIATFRSHLIKQATQKDDIVLFYFSGHGSQIKDISGDEKSDKKDETLVTYDARTNNVFDITDDQINGLIKQLNVNTENITIIIDACHSGTISRDIGVIKEAPFDSREPGPPADWEYSEAEKGIEKNSFIRDAYMKYTVITGCDYDQKSFESQKNGVYHGVLTYYLTQILDHTEENLTYKSLHERLKRSVTSEKRTQIPQIEGPRLNNLVFSDSVVHVNPYLLVNPQGSDFVSLEGGLIHNLTVGSEFEIFPPGAVDFTPKKDNPRVKIIEVSPYAAKGQFIGAKAKIADASRAVERMHYYPAPQLNIFFKGDWSSTAHKNLKTLVLGNKFAAETTTEKTSHIILEVKNGIVTRLTEMPVYSEKKFELTNTAAINKQVKDWARWFNILSLENPRKLADGYVEFSLVKPPKTEGARSVEPFDFIGRPDFQFSPDEEVDVMIKNLSDDTLNIFVIDLDPKGDIVVQMPQPGGQILISPKQTWRSSTDLGTLRINTPGILKLIVSRNRDLTLNFLNSELKDDNLEDAANKMAKASTKDGGSTTFVKKSTGLGLDSWTTDKIVFDVKK